MCSAADQHVNVHLPSQRGEHIGISGRDDLLAVNDSDFERLMLYRQ